MDPSFEELNLYVYHSIEGAFYDVVIWCLGPVVDEERSYGILRSCLGMVTLMICRQVVRAD